MCLYWDMTLQALWVLKVLLTLGNNHALLPNDTPFTGSRAPNVPTGTCQEPNCFGQSRHTTS